MVAKNTAKKVHKTAVIITNIPINTIKTYWACLPHVFSVYNFIIRLIFSPYILNSLFVIINSKILITMIAGANMYNRVNTNGFKRKWTLFVRTVSWINEQGIFIHLLWKGSFKSFPHVLHHLFRQKRFLHL